MGTGEQIRRISTYLTWFYGDAKVRGGLGMYDIHIDAESVFCHVLNQVLGCSMIDLNRVRPNHPAVDLGDPAAGIAVQVTTDTSSGKIQKTLDEFFKYDLDRTYPTRLVVMVIAAEKKYTADFTMARPYPFDKKRDIWDISRLVKEIAGLEPEKVERIYDYLRQQMGPLPGDVGQPEKPEHLLPGVPPASSSFVAGSRDRELEEAVRVLETGQPLFLWGLGGMGKTETAIQLARRYAPARGAYFLHYCDMPAGQEGEAMAETLLQADFDGYRFDGADRDQDLRQRLSILRREYAGAMLIIDNFDRAGKTLADLKGERSYQELTAMGIRLVFTTRSNAPEAGVEIGKIAEADLLALMRRHYKDPAVADDRLLELIRAVDGHTLMVDLMAKTLEESWGDVTAETMLQALRNSELDQADFPEIVNDQNQRYEQKRIYTHLKALFDLTGLDENDRAILRCGTLLPEDGMDDRLFRNCLPQEQHKPLRTLINRGLLHRENKMLTIHPVIREVCLGELEPSDENCGAFLRQLWKQANIESSYDAVQFRQLAKCFSLAAYKLEDRTGQWAGGAARLWDALGQVQTALLFNLRMVEQCEQNPSPDLITAYNNVGLIYGALGQYREELNYHLKALECMKRGPLPEKLHLAVVLNNVGLALYHLDEYEAALEIHLQVVAIREKELPASYPDLAQSYNNIGLCCAALHRHQEALEYYLKSLEISEKVLPPQHPYIPACYGNVGCTYSDLCEYEKALKCHLKALTIREKTLPPDHPALAQSYNNVGCAYSKLGIYSVALEYLEKAMVILERVLPENHPYIAAAMDNIAWARKGLAQQEPAVP